MSRNRQDPVDCYTSHSTMMQPPALKESREQAIEKLKSLNIQKRLKPVHGWPVSQTLEAYMDILGLNGREVRMNDRAH